MEIYEETFADAEESGLNEFLRTLLNSGYIEGDAAGITRLVLDKGVGALSSRQRALFMGQVIEPNTVESCDFCANPVPWSEMFSAQETGNCGHCDHMLHKDD